jgi:hypothetical protein
MQAHHIQPRIDVNKMCDRAISIIPLSQHRLGRLNMSRQRQLEREKRLPIRIANNAETRRMSKSVLKLLDVKLN